MKTTDVFHVSHAWGKPTFSELEDEIHTLLEMAEAYRWGTVDIEPNSAMAMEYYRAAARLGDSEAMLLLAEILGEFGNTLESEYWYSKIKTQYK